MNKQLQIFILILLIGAILYSVYRSNKLKESNDSLIQQQNNLIAQRNSMSSLQRKCNSDIEECSKNMSCKDLIVPAISPFNGRQYTVTDCHFEEVGGQWFMKYNVANPLDAIANRETVVKVENVN